MNYIDQIFDRCNIETICDFLMHGSELAQTNNDGYFERSKKAEKRLNEWLRKHFADSEEIDGHFNLVYSVFSEIQSIYMQIGLQAGIMLSAEFNDKKSKNG